MNKAIAVIDRKYLSEEQKKRLRTAAERCGCTLRIFDTPGEARGKLSPFGIIFGPISPGILKEAANASWFCADRVGVDTVCDEALYRNKGILLSNSAGVFSDSIAEHMIMVSLMLLRREQQVQRSVRSGGWADREMKIGSLYGSRVTILGAGNIGTALARRLRPFCPERIIGIRRHPETECPGAAASPYDRIVTTDLLDRLLPETDLLFMCLPNTESTQQIMSGNRLRLLPETAFLINAGRGTAIEQDALLELLQTGHLAGAALDVTVPEPLPENHPFRFMENVVLTPHNAGIQNLKHSVDLIVDSFCSDLDRYVKGLPLKNLINRTEKY